MNNKTKRIKIECSLNKIYVAFIKTCSKFAAIEYILLRKKHRDKSTFIIFVFSEITLIVERISEFFEICYSVSCF